MKCELTLTQVWTVGALLPWLRDTLLTERPELFLKGNSVYVLPGERMFHWRLRPATCCAQAAWDPGADQ